MSTYSHTVRIGRPLEEVFAFVTDPAGYPRWQPSLVSVEPHRPGPIRLGSEATEVRRFLGRELETTWTCVEHEPSTRSAIECEDGPVPFRGTFELEPAGGETVFTWTVETWGAASRLGGPLAGLATKRELAANAGRLKELLEAEAAACPNE
jgi:ligand-binding SRPBCC domain-containing protein